MDLAAYALAALLALAPPFRTRPLPGWAESEPEARERYASIAQDVAAVARNRTEVAALVGVAVHESGLAPDVDAMLCHRSDGWAARCDGGRAWTIWQMQTPDPWEVIVWHDRRAAAQEALRRILGSLRRCAHLEPALRLSAYASGRCATSGRAAQASRELDAHVRQALAVKESP